MYQVIKYVFGTRSLGLKLEPKGSEKVPWDIACLSNSDLDRDLLTIRRASGFVLYVLCVPVS